MSFTISGYAMLGGIPTDGLSVYAYKQSTLIAAGLVNSAAPAPPAGNIALPATFDAGPVTSGSTYGGKGRWQMSVPSTEIYYAACLDPNNTAVVGWEGELLPSPHTSQQGWSAIVTQATPRSIAETHGSGGTVTLPQATLTVADTTGFLSSGSLLVKSGNHGWVVINYTGLTGTTFTGCTNASADDGSTVTNSSVFLNAYRNDGSRRHVVVNAACVVHDSGDSALLYPVTTLDGSVFGGSSIEAVGIDSWFPPSAFTLKTRASLHLDVDPNAFYGAYGIASGGASVAVQLNNFRETNY